MHPPEPRDNNPICSGCRRDGAPMSCTPRTASTSMPPTTTRPRTADTTPAAIRKPKSSLPEVFPEIPSTASGRARPCTTPTAASCRPGSANPSTTRTSPIWRIPASASTTPSPRTRPTSTGPRTSPHPFPRIRSRTHRTRYEATLTPKTTVPHRYHRCRTPKPLRCKRSRTSLTRLPCIRMHPQCSRHRTLPTRPRSRRNPPRTSP